MRFDLASAVAVLSRTPAVLDHLLRGLPAAWITANEGAETWSPFDVVGHLIDGEETGWIPRMRIIRSDAASRRFEPFDRLRHVERNRGRSLDSLLEEFAALRRAGLDELSRADLKPADLTRTGEHPAFGTVTLEQLLATWVTHDLGHVAQIARVMAKQYAAAVGPWRAYISVLDRGPSSRGTAPQGWGSAAQRDRLNSEDRGE